MDAGSLLIKWNSQAVINTIREMASFEEQAATNRVFAEAVRNVPIGKYGAYRYPKYRGQQAGRKFKKRGSKYRLIAKYKRKNPGSLMRSIKKIESKFQDGGYLVWAGNEQRFIYYAHFIEYGTAFMNRRRGYRFLRKAIDKEKRRFQANLQRSLASDL